MERVAVRAPAEGIVTYPQGTGPVRVARGTVVARISSGNRVSEVKAYQQGYFLAALDGMEQSWRYSELWPGFQPLPEPSPLNRLRTVCSLKGPAGRKLIESLRNLDSWGILRQSAIWTSR